MAWFWIFDKDETPQRHPLRVLLDRVRAASNAQVACRVVRSRGYGLLVNEWNRTLDEQDDLMVAFDELAQVSDGTLEWFYDLDATCGEGEEAIRFGLHDSTCLFLECDALRARSILTPFKDIREGERPPW